MKMHKKMMHQKFWTKRGMGQEKGRGERGSGRGERVRGRRKEAEKGGKA